MSLSLVLFVVVTKVGSKWVCIKHTKPATTRIPVRFHNRSRMVLPLKEMAAYLADIARYEVQFVQVKVDLTVSDLFHSRCYTTGNFDTGKLLEEASGQLCSACSHCNSTYSFRQLLGECGNTCHADSDLMHHVCTTKAGVWEHPGLEELFRKGPHHTLDITYDAIEELDNIRSDINRFVCCFINDSWWRSMG